MSRPLLWLQVVAVATAAVLWFTHMHACGSEPQGESPTAAPRPKPAITSIDRSGDAQWNAFKRQHPHLALASEVSTLWVLCPPSRLRELADSCAGDNPSALMLLRSSLAAAVRIREREIRVEHVTCRAASGAGDTAGFVFCDCLLAKLPREAYAKLPGDIPDAELAPYHGPLTLTDLRIN